MNKTKKGNTVLIVDDSTLTIKFFTHLLEKKGYRVIDASSVSEASLMIGKEDISYIILDYYLSGINTGRELVEKLKKYNISITVYASSASDENNKELLESGCDDIIKPFAKDVNRLFKNLI